MLIFLSFSAAARHVYELIVLIICCPIGIKEKLSGFPKKIIFRTSSECLNLGET